ncbi:MAG: PPC domain-containing protein, partial [Myxococcota bacterium]|nr:PPC domain-containing protein [Myxococcota bacterium]
LSGTGDADLYVRKGAQPTASDYDCRPYASGTSEECIVEGPGEIYVAVNGYDDSSDYTLTVSYKSADGGSEGGDEGGDEGGEEEGGDEPTSEEASVSESGSVAKDEWKHFGPYPVAAAGALLAEMTGTGDADLYVKVGSQPTSELYDCRPYASGSDESCDIDGPGDVYVSINGYADTSDYALEIAYDAAL